MIPNKVQVGDMGIDGRIFPVGGGNGDIRQFEHFVVARPCLNVEKLPLCHAGNYPDRAIAAGAGGGRDR